MEQMEVQVKILLDRMSILTPGKYQKLKRFDYVNSSPCRFRIKMHKGSWLVDVPDHKLSVKFILSNENSLRLDDVRSVICKWVSLVERVKEEVFNFRLPQNDDIVILKLSDNSPPAGDVFDVVSKIAKISNVTAEELEQTKVLQKELYEKLERGETYIVVTKHMVTIIEIGYSNIMKLMFFPLNDCYLLFFQDNGNNFNLFDKFSPLFNTGNFLLNLPEETIQELRVAVLATAF